MLWNIHAKPVKHGVLLDHPLDDDGRCRECDAVCCRCFPHVAVTWAEYERLLALGATRLHLSLTGNYTLSIEHGCEFLAEGRCSIYAHRPDVCQRFYCRD